MISGVSKDLPHLHELAPVKEWSLRVVKPFFAGYIRLRWKVRLHDTRHVPQQGPVILAANHIAYLDGPVLVALTRRLTFALAKRELFEGSLGLFLTRVGQIPIDRHRIDRHAISRCVQVLRAGKVLAVFPEGVRGTGDVSFAKGGAAYLALITGAPIVPVAILGTRQEGQAISELPSHRSDIHVVYGEPLRLGTSPWPRRRPQVRELTEQLRRHLAEHVRSAQARTGLGLPGSTGRPESRSRGVAESRSQVRTDGGV